MLSPSCSAVLASEHPSSASKKKKNNIDVVGAVNATGDIIVFFSLHPKNNTDNCSRLLTARTRCYLQSGNHTSVFATLLLLKPGAYFNSTFVFLFICFYLLFQLLSRAWQTSKQLVAVCVEECLEPVCHSQVLLLVAAAQETVAAAAPPAVHSRCCCRMCFLSLCSLCFWRENMHPMTVGGFIFLPWAACVETVLLNVGLNNAPLLLCDVTPARCPLTPGPAHLHRDLHARLQRRHNIQPLAPGTHISFYFLLFCCCFNEMQGDMSFFFFCLRVKKKKECHFFFSCRFIVLILYSDFFVMFVF